MNTATRVACRLLPGLLLALWCSACGDEAPSTQIAAQQRPADAAILEAPRGADQLPEDASPSWEQVTLKVFGMT